jgi:hypothetical protein
MRRYSRLRLNGEPEALDVILRLGVGRRGCWVKAHNNKGKTHMNNWWENTSHNNPWYPPSNPFGPAAGPPPNPFGNSAPVHSGFVTGDQISQNVAAGQQWATNNAPAVMNTAHALFECDRQFRAASSICNNAVSSSARKGFLGGGFAEKTKDAILRKPGNWREAAATGAAAGMANGFTEAASNDDCRNMWGDNYRCRQEAKNKHQR